MLKFIHESLETVAKQSEISRKCIIALENPSDVTKDIEELQFTNGLAVVTTFNEALIFSQLFKVTIDRYATPILNSLEEFSKLKKHNNSFVRFHDEGYIIYYHYL